jgi:hypothetical protein
MEGIIKSGNSKTQASIEDHIFKLLKKGSLIIEGINYVEIEKGNPITDGLKFQVDFFIQHKLLGEVYTCKSKLLPGQRKKIHSDILKMLTIERIWDKEGKQSVKKIIVMVLSEKEFKNKNIPSEAFISETNQLEHFKIINNLGNSTWIQKTIEIFNIEIVYFLVQELSTDLEEAQARQKRS